MAKKDELLDDDDDATLSDETLLDTDVLDLGEEETDAFELDTAEETVLDAGEEDSGTLLRGSGARVMQMKRKKSHAGMTATLAVSALLLLLPLAVLLSTIYLETMGGDLGGAKQSFEWIDKINFLKPVVNAIAGLFE